MKIARFFHHILTTILIAKWTSLDFNHKLPPDFVSVGLTVLYHGIYLLREYGYLYA